MGPAPRQRGLDTLRAAAILLVWLYHYQVFVSHAPTFGVAGTVGWVGVDLFFVLSGYLIANAIFGGLVRGRGFSPLRFYARRALRTLPVFWVVLALYFAFPGELGGRTPPPLWRFLSFTQNFSLQPGTAFSHAWSLCIEEQFYAVLPLVLLAGAALRCRVGHGWALLAALSALGIGARWLLWQRYGSAATEAGYYPQVYYATLCRFDELLPGVAIAMLKNFHPGGWQGLMGQGPRLLAAALGATALAVWGLDRHYYIDGLGYGWFMTVFGYSAVAGVFALWVLAALSPTAPLQRLRVPGAASLALWSYAIYLSHKAVGYVLPKWFALDGTAWTTVALVAAASVAVGALLHAIVEAPLLSLRDRWVPGHDAVAGAAPQSWPAHRPTP